MLFRSLPTDWGQTESLPTAETRVSTGGLSGGDARTLERNLERWAADAAHQAEVRDSFSQSHRVPVALIGWQPSAPTDLDSLAWLIESAQGEDLNALLK